MVGKQNSVINKNVYPEAASVIHTSFYVDDGQTGADSISSAANLHRTLQKLSAKGEFLLRKWRTNEAAALAGPEAALNSWSG